MYLVSGDLSVELDWSIEVTSFVNLSVMVSKVTPWQLVYERPSKLLGLYSSRGEVLWVSYFCHLEMSFLCVT